MIKLVSMPELRRLAKLCGPLCKVEAWYNGYWNYEVMDWQVWEHLVVVTHPDRVCASNMVAAALRWNLWSRGGAARQEGSKK